MLSSPLPRVLGSYSTGTPGPLLIATGGMHGNEPSGARAIVRLFEALHAVAPPFRGRVLGLSGNLQALNRGERFLDRDLNRAWRPERLAALEGARPEDLSGEDRELVELGGEIEAALGVRTGAAVFLDLHTTSSDSAPFAIVSDSRVNRRLALALHVPILLGLEESLEGTLLNYVNQLGHVAIGFEAGQHDAPESAARQEAALWLTLVAAGCLAEADAERVAGLFAQRALLTDATQGLPKALELRHRHAIRPEDEFAMNPGFKNFFPIQKGSVVAHDRGGDVRTEEGGYLFMPLYQKLGEDGYFLVRRVKPFWMGLSTLLRALRFDRLLPLLPGVRRVEGKSDALLLDTPNSRGFALDVCHLLGFRKESQDGPLLLVERRRRPADPRA
ncbi:MAG TPA: succinylglutamate desuccinylase/aspartoacylase family protein [Thermoanaerobaculia bacterium]|jgi:succinylglutamate desuccinylase|nr:succinylglutamate desuccinylase/aspartoacylase family protein [Thermoanaerobaculia bacterium]